MDQDAGSGFRKHRDLGSSIKLGLFMDAWGHQRATDTDHSTLFMPKEASSWATTSKSDYG